jgi:very-short-patch-repair endonuclease
MTIAPFVRRLVIEVDGGQPADSEADLRRRDGWKIRGFAS